MKTNWSNYYILDMLSKGMWPPNQSVHQFTCQTFTCVPIWARNILQEISYFSSHKVQLNTNSSDGRRKDSHHSYKIPAI